MKLPARIDIDATFALTETLEIVDNRIIPIMQQQQAKGWQLFVVDQSCGRCYYAPQYITIPMFALDKGKEYATWYVSHELSHSLSGRKAMHGPLFMQTLKNICPKEYQHYEFGYKPRNAASAGLSVSGLSMADLL